MPEYKIFTPKSAKGLLVQYPELAEYPELKPPALKMHDLLFVWWMSCECSPYFDQEDSEKLEACIECAYPTEQQRKNKLAEFRNGFPDNIRTARKRMEAFNKHARVENYLYLQTIRENCKELLKQDPKTMNEDQKDAWAKRAPGLWKLMEETMKTIERGAFGVSEEHSDVLEDDGVLKDFRQSRR